LFAAEGVEEVRLALADERRIAELSCGVIDFANLRRFVGQICP